MVAGTTAQPARRHGPRSDRSSLVSIQPRGWERVKGFGSYARTLELITSAADAAEEEGFAALLVTTDTNLKYQQKLTGRRIAIVVLSTPGSPRIQGALDAVVCNYRPGDRG